MGRTMRRIINIYLISMILAADILLLHLCSRRYPFLSSFFLATRFLLLPLFLKRCWHRCCLRRKAHLSLPFCAAVFILLILGIYDTGNFLFSIPLSSFALLTAAAAATICRWAGRLASSFLLVFVIMAVIFPPFVVISSDAILFPLFLLLLLGFNVNAVITIIIILLLVIVTILFVCFFTVTIIILNIVILFIIILRIYFSETF
mmetsp:Transcript_42927/g.69781  ORF Transcript_42927/g.69781 Transcript_42927/m.69781 type:complete len:204 (-) Transcript_42927:295-906(-)